MNNETNDTAEVAADVSAIYDRAHEQAEAREVEQTRVDYTTAGLEYGVIVDRTSDELGFYLAAVHSGPVLRRAVALAAQLRDDNPSYPVVVNVRDVHRSEWRELLTCPTCSGPSRETVGMVCQTCGTDYSEPRP